MNLLILHGSSDLYGASKILLVTIDVCKRKGHTLTVVLTEDGPLAALLQRAGIEVIFIRLGILRRKYKTLQGILNRLLVMRKAYRSLRQLIRKKNIGLVYSNTTAVLVGAYAAKKEGIRHVWHVHEIIEKPAPLYRFLGSTLNRYSDSVIVVSEAVKKSWSRFVPEKKMHLVYNGIDYAPYLQATDTLHKELHIHPNTIVIGMIGRVHHWKGQGYFLQIAAKLAHKFSNLRFVMIGDAYPGNEYLYEEIKAALENEKIGHLVTDLGYRADIPGLLQGFDIFVLPSILPDPFPTVVLEAMASAKPVVATRHGGAVEMIDEHITGILIPINDSAQASRLMEKMITDAQLRIKMGEAGREKVLTHYSLEAFEKKLIKVLE